MGRSDQWAEKAGAGRVGRRQITCRHYCPLIGAPFHPLPPCHRPFRRWVCQGCSLYRQTAHRALCTVYRGCPVFRSLLLFGGRWVSAGCRAVGAVGALTAYNMLAETRATAAIVPLDWNGPWLWLYQTLLARWLYWCLCSYSGCH